VGKGKRADIYLEVRKGGGIYPTYLMDKSKLFHCLMVDSMYESFVMESLQNGMIISSPILSWYTVVDSKFA
jgi:hypothetical protein